MNTTNMIAKFRWFSSKDLRYVSWFIEAFNESEHSACNQPNKLFSLSRNEIVINMYETILKFNIRTMFESFLADVIACHLFTRKRYFCLWCDYDTYLAIVATLRYTMYFRGNNLLTCWISVHMNLYWVDLTLPTPEMRKMQQFCCKTGHIINHKSFLLHFRALIDVHYQHTGHKPCSHRARAT